MDAVIAEEAPGARVALLSGPSFAVEIAAGLPAAVVAASRQVATAEEVQAAFSRERFRVYTSDDATGVAIGGALKNVMAIAVGFSDGLGFGSNARAALITRGLHELGRLASRLGGHPLTLAGLAGLGDLVLTCTGELSRNRQVGLALARGETLPAILGAPRPRRRGHRHGAHRARSRRRRWASTCRSPTWSPRFCTKASRRARASPSCSRASRRPSAGSGSSRPNPEVRR